MPFSISTSCQANLNFDSGKTRLVRRLTSNSYGFLNRSKMCSFRNVEDYAREHEEASKNIQQYLSNPINAYLLVKRLTTDWKKVEELITEDVGKSFVANITNSRSDLKFPTDEDLNGAAVALMRLQDTYKLETAHVARGVLNGVQYSTGLSGTCEFFAQEL